MTTAKKYGNDGSETGVRDLPAGLFSCEISEPSIHEAVLAYLANQRQGNASTKERSDVRGGGKKPYRQKGTGRARAGTIRSPIFRGGGIVFGPHPRSYRIDLPKRIKRRALLSALSARAGDGGINVVADLEYSEPKTKTFASMLKNMDCDKSKVLFVLDKPNPAVVKSARNIPGVKVTLGNMVATYDVVWADRIILTESALALMEEVLKDE